MRLPEQFADRMKRMLGEEYQAFTESLEGPPFLSLRVNTLKLSPGEFEKISPFAISPVPWAEGGFYYEEPDRPGKHPWHEAGLYYIQEASAMATGALAGACPGERVLDLCAAPGGKTTHLASSMEGQGLLVSNEIHPGRAKILSSNVERMGIPNAVVTNETPERLARRFPAFFDRIVVDAPCSGEGMFRKEEQALLQWTPENVVMCAARQQEILEQAAGMLRPGGVLAYSTCTFAPEENEGSIAAFLYRHPEFSVRRAEAWKEFAPGRPEWAGLEKTAGPDADPERTEAILRQIGDTFRLWPHRLRGEGHYVAVLEKTGQKEAPQSRKEAGKAGGRKDMKTQEAMKLYREFAAATLTEELPGVPVLFGEQLFLLPEPMDLSGLKVLRAGLHLGTAKKNRFEPAHALALALKGDKVLRTCDYPADSEEIRAYLRGESLEYTGEDRDKGWTLVLAGGYSLGWGKLSAGVVKNHYPRGLRQMR